MADGFDFTEGPVWVHDKDVSESKCSTCSTCRLSASNEKADSPAAYT